MTNQFERLQKVIAQSGLTSRRKAEQLILDGRVKVNNKIVRELGTKVTTSDEIQVDNIPIEKEKLVYYVLYKPRGYISSVKDEKDRETVIDLMDDVKERIFPIGRLDYNTSGVLLLTNDGEFAHLLMHPKHEIEKVYIVKIKGIPSKETLAQMRKGVKDEGDILRAVDYKVTSIDRKKNTMIVQIKLHEGKNRHIRRMMDQLGHPVLKLKREKYGSITVDQLQPGKYRSLSRQEVHQLTMHATNVKQ
ncbi:pseudouridine synthase [Pseudogracilibacillus auburnensis]|uniref:Pseudouridine synthase n=1 Tax=Pseudogracilibacillus auburnensis TaxID=1494959 RepID=A0A2V3W3P4_9BACI|nr:pseudouridine synthase [Pseudogracilibacillus auburnensis]MBO1003084.1 rRNA pseudouridine synthase [Pseudogracilibacillus auburnensis]PXW88712.1 ribosomal large subunit pseudouridine synthase B [Pseudogracilibacillus auburnensis]